jgi:hypothetical protein
MIKLSEISINEVFHFPQSNNPILYTYKGFQNNEYIYKCVITGIIFQTQTNLEIVLLP